MRDIKIKHSVGGGDKMGFYQWGVVSICIFLNIIDGFDVLVMAFTASAVAQNWGLTGVEIGGLLSSGLLGMGGGSILIAPWADIVGRRKVIILSLILVSVGMILSSFSVGFWQLFVLRFITGLGIGGILACSNVLTSEYSSIKWRSLAISLQSAGYGLGAASGGVTSLYLIESYGWQSVFLFGGGISTIFVFIVIFTLPESPSYLLLRQPANSLERINKIYSKIGLSGINSLPLKRELTISASKTYSSLFIPNIRMSTIYIWIAFFCVMFGFHCILSWTPKLLTGAGMTADQGISVSVWMNLGSMFGAVLIGFLGTKYDVKFVHIIFLICTASFTVLFASNLNTLYFAIILAFILGIVVNGSMAGLYIITPTLYKAANRATGVGAAIGIGRAGSIISPVFIGVLLDLGWTPKYLFYLVSIVFVIAVFIIMKIRKL